MMVVPIHIYSEIGPLKTVLLKRPGQEIENFTPEMMTRLLFDDIPYLPTAQKEHDAFAKVLQAEGVEVLYLDDLLAQALTTDAQKDQFLTQFLHESELGPGAMFETIKDHLLGLETPAMIQQLIAGIRKNALAFKPTNLTSFAEASDYPFYLDPMPNLYFTRDPAAAIGEGLTINHLTFAARQRESLFMETIIRQHPRFAHQGLQVWRNRNHGTRIEGGDELVLNHHTVAIGVSQRTSAYAIQDIARSLFSHDSGFDTVIAIDIPKNHAMMHLDTVFTMINHDQFTVHPGILGEGGKIDTWTLRPSDNADGYRITHSQDLRAVLKAALGVSELDLLPTGGGDEIIAGREQWNDGSNTLALAPGVVVTYDRNYISNQLMRQHGIRVIEIPSSELSRGRGGPRCMSMPLIRADLAR